MELLPPVDAGEIPAGAPNHYVEQLRVPTMSVGRYLVPTHGHDDQLPHAEDEVYVVIAGRGVLARTDRGGERIPVAPGSAVFVPAGEPHRFVDVTEDLEVLAFLSPPYSGRPG